MLIATEDDDAYRFANLKASQYIATEQGFLIFPMIFDKHHWDGALHSTVGPMQGGYWSRFHRASIKACDGINNFEKTIGLRDRQEQFSVNCC